MLSLDITIPYQQQQYWCWVAVGSGIASWYDNTVYQQCYVVTLVFTAIHPGFDTNCCSPASNASGPACNLESGADQALNYPEHHFNYNILSPLGWSEIVGQIAARRPFAARIAWANPDCSAEVNNGAHFVAITGYASPLVAFHQDFFGDYVYVQDPANGPGWYTLSSFSSSYEGSGTWCETTLSQP